MFIWLTLALAAPPNAPETPEDPPEEVISEQASPVDEAAEAAPGPEDSEADDADDVKPVVTAELRLPDAVTAGETFSLILSMKNGHPEAKTIPTGPSVVRVTVDGEEADDLSWSSGNFSVPAGGLGAVFGYMKLPAGTYDIALFFDPEGALEGVGGEPIQTQTLEVSKGE